MRRIILLLTGVTVMAAILVMGAGSALAQVGRPELLPPVVCLHEQSPVISGLIIDGDVFFCDLTAPPDGDIIIE